MIKLRPQDVYPFTLRTVKFFSVYPTHALVLKMLWTWESIKAAVIKIQTSSRHRADQVWGSQLLMNTAFRKKQPYSICELRIFSSLCASAQSDQNFPCS